MDDHDFVIVAGDKCGGVRVYGGKNNVRDLKELFARDVPDMGKRLLCRVIYSVSFLHFITTTMSGHVTCMGFQQVTSELYL